MRCVQRVGNVDRETEQLIDREPACCQHILQRPAVEPFHCDERLPTVFRDLVDRADRRMIERRRRSGFPSETLDCRLIPREDFRQELQGDLASEGQVLGEYTTPIPPPPSSESIR